MWDVARGLGGIAAGLDGDIEVDGSLDGVLAGVAHQVEEVPPHVGRVRVDRRRHVPLNYIRHL